MADESMTPFVQEEIEDDSASDQNESKVLSVSQAGLCKQCAKPISPQSVSLYIHSFCDVSCLQTYLQSTYSSCFNCSKQMGAYLFKGKLNTKSAGIYLSLLCSAACGIRDAFCLCPGCGMKVKNSMAKKVKISTGGFKHFCSDACYLSLKSGRDSVISLKTLHNPERSEMDDEDVEEIDMEAKTDQFKSCFQCSQPNTPKWSLTIEDDLVCGIPAGSYGICSAGCLEELAKRHSLVQCDCAFCGDFLVSSDRSSQVLSVVNKTESDTFCSAYCLSLSNLSSGRLSCGQCSVSCARHSAIVTHSDGAEDETYCSIKCLQGIEESSSPLCILCSTSFTYDSDYTHSFSYQSLFCSTECRTMMVRCPGNEVMWKLGGYRIRIESATQAKCYNTNCRTKDMNAQVCYNLRRFCSIGCLKEQYPPCDQCKKTMLTPNSVRTMGGQRFCSLNCVALFKKPPPAPTRQPTPVVVKTEPGTTPVVPLCRHCKKAVGAEVVKLKVRNSDKMVYYCSKECMRKHLGNLQVTKVTPHTAPAARTVAAPPPAVVVRPQTRPRVEVEEEEDEEDEEESGEQTPTPSPPPTPRNGTSRLTSRGQRQSRVETRDKKIQVNHKEPIFKRDKFAQAKPVSFTRACQTDECYPVPIVIPIPMPVPVVMQMYEQPVPCAVPFPLPFPVPLPMALSGRGVKRFNEVLDKMVTENKVTQMQPNNPEEADLLLIAQALKDSEAIASALNESKADPAPKPTKGLLSQKKWITKDQEPLESAETSEQFREETMRLYDQVLLQVSQAGKPGRKATQIKRGAVQKRKRRTASPVPPKKRKKAGKEKAEEEPVPATSGRAKRKSALKAAKNLRSWTGNKPKEQESGDEEEEVIDLEEEEEEEKEKEPDDDDRDVEYIPNEDDDPGSPRSPQFLQVSSAVQLLNDTWTEWASSSEETEQWAGDPMQLSRETLATALQQFIRTVKKPDGEDATNDFVFRLLLEMQHYLSMSGRQDSLFTGNAYLPVMKALQESIDDDDDNNDGFVQEEHLYTLGHIGSDRPEQLINTVIYAMHKADPSLTAKQLLQISFDSMRRTGKDWDGNATQWHFAVVDDTARNDDAITAKIEDKKLSQIIDVYQSKCPAFNYYACESSPFLLTPEKNWNRYSPVWMTRKPLDVETVQLILNRLTLVVHSDV